MSSREGIGTGSGTPWDRRGGKPPGTGQNLSRWRVRWGARVARWRFKIPPGYVISEVQSPVSSAGVDVSNQPPGYRLRPHWFTVGTLKTASIRGKPQGPCVFRGCCTVIRAPSVDASSVPGSGYKGSASRQDSTRVCRWGNLGGGYVRGAAMPRGFPPICAAQGHEGERLVSGPRPWAGPANMRRGTAQKRGGDTLAGAVLRGPRPRVPPVVGGGCPCYGLRGYYSHGFAIARRIGCPLFLRTHSPGRR